MRISFLLLLLHLWSQLALAWPPTYGSEYNFSSYAIDAAWQRRMNTPGLTDFQRQKPDHVEQQAATDFANAVFAECAQNCTMTPHQGKFESIEYEIRFEDGYNFNISVDPDCVEIQTAPESLAQLKQYEARTQKLIFDVAKKLKMHTGEHTAHFNIGVRSAFEDNPKAFVKFIADYANNPELQSGVLGTDFANAPPISHLKDKQRSAFAEIVDKANRGKYSDVDQIAKDMQTRVYTETPTFDVGFQYQSIGMKAINKPYPKTADRPFELRAPRQPKTAAERTLLAELMEKRFEYLRNSDEPAVFLDLPKKPYFTNDELANSFRVYIAEMGASWDHFNELLPSDLRDIPPDHFISGEISWKSKRDVQLMKRYAARAPASSWIREKLQTYLDMPQALNSNERQSITEILDPSTSEPSSKKKGFFSCLLGRLGF